MTEAINQHSERSPRYHLVTFLILVPVMGIPLVIGSILSLSMPTWLAPPDVHIWNTIHLYLITCELLWIIPTVLVLRLRKFPFNKAFFILFVAFIIFWGFWIMGSLYDNTSALIFWITGETATCEYHEANGHVYYDCYGYFSDVPPIRSNRTYDWQAIFEGSSTVPLVKVPCRIGWC